MAGPLWRVQFLNTENLSGIHRQICFLLSFAILQKVHEQSDAPCRQAWLSLVLGNRNTNRAECHGPQGIAQGGGLSPNLVSSEHRADKDSEKRQHAAITWHLPRQGQRNKFGTGLTSGPPSDGDEYWITAQTSSAATASRSHQNISRFFGSGGGYGFGMSLGGTRKLAIIGGNRGIQTAQGRAQSAMRRSC
jgi:hypothetical protein